MRSAILNVTFDCGDSAAVARFWSAVTRWPAEKVEMPGNPFWVVADPERDGPQLVFVEVPEPKGGKNRVHLDLLPQGGSQDDELARLQALGAVVVDDRRTAEPGGWIMMADPEGNEFCLEPND
ncbi:VOC family protein [Kribbella sp. NPDC058693]|uniref:VOC family protein n=1 Tax=Kribbella sp. NPDC058693 TaxID=3346602 RepID=UPI0036523B2B